MLESRCRRCMRCALTDCVIRCITRGRGQCSSAWIPHLRRSATMALRKIRIGLLLSAHMTPGPVRIPNVPHSTVGKPLLLSAAGRLAGFVVCAAGFGAEPHPVLEPPSLSSASLRKRPSIRIGLRIGTLSEIQRFWLSSCKLLVRASNANACSAGCSLIAEPFLRLRFRKG